MRKDGSSDVNHVPDAHGARLVPEALVHPPGEVKTSTEELGGHVLRLNVEGRRVPSDPSSTESMPSASNYCNLCGPCALQHIVQYILVY